MKARIGIFFLSFGLDIFAGIENSLYNLALGLIENGAEVFVYSGYLSGRQNRIGDIDIYRSEFVPSVLPRGDETIRSVLQKNSDNINIEIKEFISKNQISHIYTRDPLWGIIQQTGIDHLGLPATLGFSVVNSQDLLLQAKATPYSLYTAVSDSLRSQILEKVNLSPFKVIPNSINLASFRKSNVEQQIMEPIIFCNGRISPEKGIIYLVQSFYEVSKKYPKAELWLCGGSFPFGDRPVKYIEEVKNRIIDLGISSQVRILPNLPWAQIPEIVYQSTIVVLPSLIETFGRGALDGMAAGKPVVVSDAGNLPSLVRDAGMVVEKRSVHGITDAILKLLNDDELRKNLGEKGKYIAQEYSNVSIAHLLMNYMNIK